jgi:hypothetical protein
MKFLMPYWIATVATTTVSVLVVTNLENVMAQQAIPNRPSQVKAESLQQSIQKGLKNFKAEVPQQSSDFRAKLGDKLNEKPSNTLPPCVGDQCKPVPGPMLLPGLITLGAGFLFSRIRQKRAAS